MEKTEQSYNMTYSLVGRKKKQYIGYWRHENMDHEINIYIER